MSKTIYLPLKKRWFEMIASGVKREEYRAISPYWIKRFIETNDEDPYLASLLATGLFGRALHIGYGRRFDEVVFTLGYPAQDDRSRRMRFEISDIRVATGNPDWGAEPGVEYFVIRLGKRID